MWVENCGKDAEAKGLNQDGNDLSKGSAWGIDNGFDGHAACGKCRIPKQADVGVCIFPRHWCACPWRSVSFGQAEGVVRWQSGFFETGLGAGDVVSDPAVDEQTLLEVVEHIAGPRIIITGLANAADVHRVAFLGIEACGFFRWLEKATSEGFGIFLPD